jgi:osmoprotectant transport system ATP-binding protein
MASLQLKGIVRRYAATTVIHGIDLDVRDGEFVVFVGPSGCGKSTLLRMISGLESVSEGELLIDGKRVNEVSAAQRGLAMVFQSYALYPHMTVYQNMAFGLENIRTPQADIDAKVQAAAKLLQLGPLLDRRPTQLSGGQRQRVGVARALAGDPPLMLMDEPFGAIDPINRARLQNELLRLQERIRKTIVFVTHDIDEAIKMGDRIAVLKQGGVLAQYARPAELLMQPADEFVKDFVGADRALKRLALEKVRDVDLWRAPRVRVGDTVTAARRAIEGSDLRYPLVVDDAGRPVAWLDEDDLRGERIEPGTGAPVLSVEREDLLRDALSELLVNEVQYGAVVDGDGRVDGVLSIEIIHDFLVPEAEGLVEPA